MADDLSVFVSLTNILVGTTIVLGGSQRPNQEIQGPALPGLPQATSVSKESCLLSSDSQLPVVSMVATNNKA